MAASVCHKQIDQLRWNVVPDRVGHLEVWFMARPLRNPAGLAICEGCIADRLQADSRSAHAGRPHTARPSARELAIPTSSSHHTSDM